MRVLFYDYDAGALGIQSLLAVLEGTAHEVYLYLDCSCPRQYLADNRLLERLFTLTPKQICDDLMAYDADVFCFSITSLTFATILRLINLVRIRKPDAIVVCGGVHSTLLPEKVLLQPNIDFTVVGEAEFSFPALLAALDQHGVTGAKALPADVLPGIWNIHNGQIVARGLSPIPHDLNAIPFLNKSLHHLINPGLTPVYSTVSFRGCFYKCSFCNDPAIREVYERHDSPYCRGRTVDALLAELQFAKEHYHPKHIEFHDDIFASDRVWLEEFSRRYPVEIGLPFNVQTHPLLLDDEKLEMLAHSGCTMLEFGIQSASSEVREQILRRYETNDRVEYLVQKAKGLGMRVETDFIVNLPGETPDHLDQIIEFVYKTRPSLVNLHFLVCLPKTEIADIALRMGAVSEEEVEAVLERGHLIQAKYPTNALAMRYRILPIEFYVACLLPTRISRKINRVLENKYVGSVCAPLGPLFVVGTRLVAGLFDRRAYLYWFQFCFGLRNMGKVILRKVLGKRHPRLRLGGGER